MRSRGPKFRADHSQGYTVRLALGLLLAVGIGVVDFFTGYQINFSIFYLIPLIVLTWFTGAGTGLVLAGVNSVISLFADILVDFRFSHDFYPYWDAFVRTTVFLVTVALVSRIRLLHRRQAALIGELQAAMAEIKRLSGLIPICAWCKKVREDGGFWTQVEDYIKEHSEADFTHSICPDCETSMRLQTSLEA